MAFGAFQTAAPAGGQAPVTQVQKKSPVALWLLLPGILYLILFFVTPLFSLVITSFQAPIPGGFLGEFQTAFRWENYAEVVSTYFSHISRSFIYATLATIFALLLGYPIAYVIGGEAAELSASAGTVAGSPDRPVLHLLLAADSGVEADFLR